jgi:hypothetical protein
MSSAEDIMAGFTTIADACDRVAAQLADLQAAGKPDKWLVHKAIEANRYIAAVTRGDAGAAPDGAS